MRFVRLILTIWETKVPNLDLIVWSVSNEALSNRLEQNWWHSLSVRKTPK